MKHPSYLRTSMQSIPSNEPVFRITALWAFSECALGGVMHALKLPFTGFFVGGFAVLCIGLLAHISHKNAAVILRSTLLVVLVKAIVSPHSPPTAYLAVSFQGVIGALILCYLRPAVLAAFLFGFLALVESAFQKILVLLLFFGKPLFEAVDIFFTDVLKNFGVQSQISWAAVVVYAYVGLYAVWGLVLGYWITKLPGQIENKNAAYANLSFSETIPDNAPEQKKKYPWLFPALVLVFVAITFLLAGGKSTGAQKALFAVMRSVAVLLAWFFIVQPMVAWAFHRWAKKKAADEQGALTQIMNTLPGMRSTTRLLYQHIAQQYKGWKRYREFVIALFVVSIHRTT